LARAVLRTGMSAPATASVAKLQDFSASSTEKITPIKFFLPRTVRISIVTTIFYRKLSFEKNLDKKVYAHIAGFHGSILLIKKDGPFHPYLLFYKKWSWF
jgi:hypothetical protein